MKAIITLFFLLTLLSCDKCRDVSCGVGECEKGDCICPEPYEGEGCYAHKYAGEYVGNIYYVTTYTDGSPTTYDTSFAVEIPLDEDVFYAEITWGENGAFELTPLEDHAEKVTGSGSVTGNTLIVNAGYSYPSSTHNFKFEGVRE